MKQPDGAAEHQYVSRAALKLDSVAGTFKLNFQDKVVLDVGSSTGGFTDYVLQHGAGQVVAVEVGTNQLHPSLRINSKVELHEKTDIRDVWLRQTEPRVKGHEARVIIDNPDIILADLSFISLRDVLSHISHLMSHDSQLVAMVKPQFEAGDQYKHKGIIKNEKIRRDILKQFENWVQKLFVITNKADSEVTGAKGNRERFYLLKKSS